jgi:hypothetical protein
LKALNNLKIKRENFFQAASLSNKREKKEIIPKKKKKLKISTKVGLKLPVIIIIIIIIIIDYNRHPVMIGRKFL